MIGLGCILSGHLHYFFSIQEHKKANLDQGVPIGKSYCNTVIRLLKIINTDTYATTTKLQQ